MDMKKAMQERHMVRRYTDKPISREAAEQLARLAEGLNMEHGTAIELRTGDSRAFGALTRLVLAKGVHNYFLMAGEERPGQVSAYEGDAPEWFKEGVKAALLAPTALNRQGFMLTGSGRRVELRCENGIFSGVDAGLVKYHFELGAGTENFEWV